MSSDCLPSFLVATNLEEFKGQEATPTELLHSSETCIILKSIMEDMEQIPQFVSPSSSYKTTNAIMRPHCKDLSPNYFIKVSQSNGNSIYLTLNSSMSL